MNKYTLPLLAVFGLLAYVAIATQDASLTQKEVRNPRYLETYLEANATDAESRIASLEGGSTVGSVLPGYIIVGSSSTAGVDVAVSGDMSITTSGVVTVTGATGAFTVLGTTGAGIDTVGATALFIGEENATSVSVGASDADTVILGGLTVRAGTGAGFDTTAGGALYVGEATATSILLGATDTPTSVVGGLGLAYALKTGSYTNGLNDVVVTYNTSAVTTNLLPEASTALGKLFIVALQDDDGDLRVDTDGTDTFDGTNTRIVFADAGDSCVVMATAANVYTILSNTGGTLATQ